MNRLYFPVIIIVFVLVLVGIGLIVNIKNSGEQVVEAQDVSYGEKQINQQGIIDTITNDLKQQGVPIVSVQVIDFAKANPPLALEYTLVTMDKSGTPDDPIYVNLINHAVNLAQRRGLNIGDIETIFIDSNGKTLTQSGNIIMKLESISSDFDPPYKISDEVVSRLLNTNISSNRMSLLKVDVSQGTDGLRNTTFNLQVPDISIANAEISSFMRDTNQNINNLNLQSGAQIAIFKVNISTSDGTLLFKYINDVLFRHQSWWQADGIANWGFPQPPTTLPLSSN